MFLVKKKKCAGHTYYSAVSPPSEFYNIIIDSSKVKCLICANIVGRLDSKIDSIVLDIEKIRLVRIEPRNLTAVCTSKEANHSHEMLVSSAYCDTVYKSYTKPEFYSVSRYQTLKQPCSLLPDKILGFNFISSISRSFRYIRVHRFRHPSSLRGVYNPLSFANLQISTFSSSATDSSTVLSDSSTISTDSTPSSLRTVSVVASTSSPTLDVESDLCESTPKPMNNTAAQGFFSTYSTYEPIGPTAESHGDSPSASYHVSLKDYSIRTPRPENTTDLASNSSFLRYNVNSNAHLSSETTSMQQPNVIFDPIAPTSVRYHYNGYEVPGDFDMVHFD
ncbi:uncharacterized protein LOC129568095 [Sitodiplosis mosellana]|uniref:uncharacterized protein LOC129568095 n=1 Tax=Sitodiplosis mosellana TaxID=263140 RepID=UPI00244394EB|nr:uncharacterized protein LOC129568095 [Sitodiplosis mosellana]